MGFKFKARAEFILQWGLRGTSNTHFSSDENASDYNL